jgi:hypothetical protein
MAKVDLKNATITLKGGGSGESLEVKIGDGSISWTEYRAMEYALDRGKLDSVRLADEQPVDVNLEFMWEWVRGTSATATPLDAIQVDPATGLNHLGWESTSEDECEPFAIDIEVKVEVLCGAVTQTETITLPEFRYEQLDYNIAEGQIATSGKCNVLVVEAVRS